MTWKGRNDKEPKVTIGRKDSHTGDDTRALGQECLRWITAMHRFHALHWHFGTHLCDLLCDLWFLFPFIEPLISSSGLNLMKWSTLENLLQDVDKVTTSSTASTGVADRNFVCPCQNRTVLAAKSSFWLTLCEGILMDFIPVYHKCGYRAGLHPCAIFFQNLEQIIVANKTTCVGPISIRAKSCVDKLCEVWVFGRILGCKETSWSGPYPSIDSGCVSTRVGRAANLTNCNRFSMLRILESPMQIFVDISPDECCQRSP